MPSRTPPSLLRARSLHESRRFRRDAAVLPSAAVTKARLDRSGLLRALGPGVLFTGTAVGVSHLVQSTRAGALYGFGLMLVVVLANVVKYPAFRFGPLYAVATGTSLLEGYRRQGRWALVLYALLTVGTMFTVQAAVTMMTAGLLKALLGVDASPLLLSGVLIFACAALLALGHFRWLDLVMKGVVVVLTLSTIAAAAIALPAIDFGSMPLWPDATALEPASIFFIVGLVGWMPSAFDVAVWQSLWTLARQKDTGHRPSMRESMFDFHLGYVGTAFLALCFVVLGAAVMHGRGVTLAESAGAFAAQVVDLYVATLGEASRPIIGICAFATMFSTTLTVVDGFPRALSVLVARFREPEETGAAQAELGRTGRVYWGSVVVIAVGSMLILSLFVRSLLDMVDLATTLSFLTAPVLAVLNHRAVTGAEVPADARPRPWLVASSWASIAVLSLFALYYLLLRFGS
jgi:Mn2+/Fe2+ NRAMP family transporter